MGADHYLLIAFGLFLLIACIYSSVGHGGASGYLAVMAMLSFPVGAIKPTSLVLNILVSAIATHKFLKKGYFNRKVFLTFAIASIPAAFISGMLSLQQDIFKWMAGVFLLLSSVMLIFKSHFEEQSEKPLNDLTVPVGLTIGGIVGFFSGLIGVGGGIFLSPVMILKRWTTVRQASGTAALFILTNSMVALIGHYSQNRSFDKNILFWAIAVIIGGLIGSYLGTTKLNNKILLFLLFIVLFSAGIKFILYS